MFTSLFLTIGLIHLIALASPGPDFALILRTSLHRPTALGAALGIALAILVHATLSLTGISLLIAEHPWLFMTVKVVGALYLGWLGWGALKAAWHSSAELALRAGGEAQGWRKGVQRGIATNLLNPKALLFFMGLLAAMVTPQVDGLTRGLAGAGAVPAVSDLVWRAGLEPLHRAGPASARPRAASAQSGHRPAVWRGQPLHPDRHGRRGLRPGPALTPVCQP